MWLAANKRDVPELHPCDPAHEESDFLNLRSSTDLPRRAFRFPNVHLVQGVARTGEAGLACRSCNAGQSVKG
jgi:hypothetical protein